MYWGFLILTYFLPLLTQYKILISISALILTCLYHLWFLHLNLLNCLPPILLLHLLFLLAFLLFQSTLLQSLFLSPINLQLSLLLSTLNHQTPYPLASLFQHLIQSLLTLILCKQGPSLEFTILDYILLYFLLILNPKMLNRPWKIQIGLLQCSKSMVLCWKQNLGLSSPTF